MKPLHFVLLALLCILLPAAVASADEPSDLQRVNGPWVPESIVFNGQPLPAELLNKIRVELSDGGYVATVDQAVERGTFTFDESKSPKEMDVTITAGPRKNNTILAIYKLDGDKSTVCYGATDGQRPMSFAAPAGSQFMLIEYRRPANE